MIFFLKKSILFAFVFFLFIFFGLKTLLNLYPQYFLNGDPKDYYINYLKEKHINTRSNFTNLIIGDSRGLASLKPKILGEKWLNLCLPGSNFLEGYYLVKQYTKKNRIDTLVLNYGIDYIEGNSYFFSRRTIPFNNITISDLNELEILEDKMMPGMIYGDDLLKKNSFLLNIEKYKRNLKYKHFPLSYRETVINGFSNLIKNSKNNSNLEIELAENNGQLDFEQTDKNHLVGILTKQKTFKQNIINHIYLDSIINFSKRNNIVVILTIAPINKSTYLFLNNSAYWNSSSNYLDSIKTEYPEVKLITNPFFLNNEMFSDDRHLNKQGALIYTNILKEEIFKLKTTQHVRRND